VAGELKSLKDTPHPLFAAPIEESDLLGREELVPPEPIEHIELAVVDSEWHTKK
jgi:hypothetical protein